MNLLRLSSYELRRFRQPLARLGLAFVLLVPLLYGALYLWSTWDPYGRLDDVPVAVVDEDEPVTVDGNDVDGGATLVEALKRDEIFDWQYVDLSEATDGLAAGRYLMVVYVPPDFSARLASGVTGTPERATVELRFDDANGYVFTTMAKTVQADLEQRIDQAATTAYFESVYGDIDRIRAGIDEASTGSGEVTAGVSTAQEGSAALVIELTALKDQSAALVPAAQQVSAGVTQLSTLVVPLAQQLIDAVAQVTAGVDTLAQSAAQLNTTIATGAASLANQSADVTAAVETLGQDPQVAQDPAYQALVAANAQLASTAAQAATLSQQVATDSQRIAVAAVTVSSQAPQLEQQVTSASGQVTQLTPQAQQVADSAAAVDAGVGTALTGAQELDTSMSQLVTESTQLSEDLDASLGQIPTQDAATRERNAEILGSPADVLVHVDNPAEVYGRGLAPFYFSIALWIFGIVALLILRPISARALASRARSLTVALAGWLPMLALGLVAAAILVVVVDVGLGLDPVHLAAFLGILALAVATFTALVQLCRVALGVAGNAVALVLLMLQLTSCAGIFPLPQLPAPFRFLHPLMPMTYLVDGLRISISGGPSDRFWRDVAVLAGILLVALAVTTLVVVRRRRWTVGRLKPQLQLEM